MRYLVDTNVILRWSPADSPDQPACARAIDDLLDTGSNLCVCAQVLIEFWVVATRPASANGLGLTVTQASELVANLREIFTILPEPLDIADKWQAIVEKHAVQGKQAHDARIAALMLAHGVTHILTFNANDFTRYQSITAVSPLDIPVQ